MARITWASLVGIGVWLVSAHAFADKSAVQVDDNGIDCHFEGDPNLNFFIDDRGGKGVAYDFEMLVGGGAGNHSFCPHCRLTLFTCDLDLPLVELGKIGKVTSEITSLVGLGLAIDDAINRGQEVIQAIESGQPVEGLESLKAAFEAADLAALKDKIQAWVEGLLDAKTRLVNLVDLPKNIASGAVDLSGDGFDALVEQLGVKMDTGFRAMFDNPNDPKRHNSGIKVFSLDEIVQGLIASKIPKDVQDAISGVLSSIPSLPGGLFEMSGDDDDVTKPVQFHGKNTDLTVLQRSYAVPGNPTVLLEWTIVNSSGRILPLVEVAMINDFDIPPLSYDKATEWDGATKTVMVYDEHPYLDPVKHYYFGFAPVLEASPDPTKSATFANYNLDDQISLAQWGSDVTENSRIKFFLWDPEITGDQDDAVGKSEKQGAISLQLPGPMLPGEQRTVAFCVAEGDGASKSAAKAAMMARLVACKGMYTAVTAKCGNGVIQLGELCDDSNTANGDGCGSDCTPEVCGDGALTGAEECDDENTDSNDGCSEGCLIERCGDGIKQTSEQCDDADTDDHDACLSTCRNATCGDGVTRECDVQAGEVCDVPCGGAEACFSGDIVFSNVPAMINGKPSTGAFAGLKDLPLTYSFSFDVVSVENKDVLFPEFMPGIVLHSGPVSVKLGGDPVWKGLAAALEGATWDIQFGASSGSVNFSAALVRLGGAVEGFGIEFSGPVKGLKVDADGRPQFGAFSHVGGATLRRYAPLTGTMTDYADGKTSSALTEAPSGPPPGGLEACDDGNASDVDDCTTACRVASCGDGFLHVGSDEQCDPAAGSESPCTSLCTLPNIAACGDGQVDHGEQCDDKNTANGDGCTAFCSTEFCGDGVIQTPEVCDDGNTDAGDGCSATCVTERCGDGVMQGTEACDEGEANAEVAACLPTCAAASCGDTFVLAGVEACDDGNLDPGDGCGATCALETCGDGLPGKGEECDDNNSVAGDGCGATCALEFCGDGLAGPDEECDGGNAAAGDGCSKDCRLEFPDACGDGKVGPGEQCDDGGAADGDGCNGVCQLENPAACGDGNVDPGEECDDSGTVSGDGCSAGCAIERCGDQVQQPGEQCDDGDTESGDGCSAVCLVEPSECGNGTQELGEQCDDGNKDDSDSCVNCASAEGSVTVIETCGDGKQDPGEACDDGGHFEGDGCDEVCQLEATICGNGKLEPGEACDDGDPAAAGDGCDASCALESVCGNKKVELGEACDDGGTASNDGCNSACKAEFCGDGVVQPTEACDSGSANSDTAPDACRLTCEPAFCGDGVEDEGECEANACSADCPTKVVEAEKKGGGCGKCVAAGRGADTDDALAGLVCSLVLALIYRRSSRDRSVRSC